MSQEQFVSIVEGITVSTMFICGILMIVIFKLYEIHKLLEKAYNTKKEGKYE